MMHEERDPAALESTRKNSDEVVKTSQATKMPTTTYERKYRDLHKALTEFRNKYPATNALVKQNTVVKNTMECLEGLPEINENTDILNESLTRLAKKLFQAINQAKITLKPSWFSSIEAPRSFIAELEKIKKNTLGEDPLLQAYKDHRQDARLANTAISMTEGQENLKSIIEELNKSKDRLNETLNETKIESLEDQKKLNQTITSLQYKRLS